MKRRVDNAREFCLFVSYLLCWQAVTTAAENFQQSFLGGETGEPMLLLDGLSAAEHAKPQTDGYTVSLPASETSWPPTGLVTQFGVRGDFEITAAYQIVESQPPDKGYGAGVWLAIFYGSGDGASISRFAHPKKGEIVSTDQISHGGAPGQKHHVRTKPAQSNSGKLQLVREGNTLRYLIAEDDGAFEEVRRETLDTSDLTRVRFAADTGQSTGALIVKFTHFSIRADALAIEPLTESKARTWILLWLAGTVALVGTIATGVVAVRKRGPPWREAQNHHPPHTMTS